MPRQNSGSRSQQDHRGANSKKPPGGAAFTASLSRTCAQTSVWLFSPPQFLSRPRSTWSPCTSRSPASRPIGSSPAGSGSSRRWTAASAAATPPPAGASSSSATWASARRPSSPAWWLSAVTGIGCGRKPQRTRPCRNVSKAVRCQRLGSPGRDSLECLGCYYYVIIKE